MTPFAPQAATTANIDVSSSTQRVKIADAPGPLTIRVMNNGTATAWVDFGGSAIDATVTASFPVGPGVTEVLIARHTKGAVYAAAIAAGATGKIYFTPGTGI